MAKRKPYRFFLFCLIKAASQIVVWMPREVAQGFARLGGSVAWRLVGRQRIKVSQHLRMAYGAEKNLNEITTLGRGVFKNFAMTAAEVLQFSKLTPEKVDQLVDPGQSIELYDRILAEGRGLISVTAHIGNWELLAGYFGMKGYKGAVLARRLYYEPYNRWIVGLRACLKVPTIYRDDSSREILERLRRGEIIGLLPDQDIDSLKGVFVPFFGRLAYTPVAPARLSLASGAPIVPNFLIRTAGGRYKIITGRVIRPGKTGTSSSRERDEVMGGRPPITGTSEAGESRESIVKSMTEDWMHQFEEVIRAYPDQWAWMHNRWKTQPAADSKNNLNNKETIRSL